MSVDVVLTVVTFAAHGRIGDHSRALCRNDTGIAGAKAATIMHLFLKLASSSCRNDDLERGYSLTGLELHIHILKMRGCIFP